MNTVAHCDGSKPRAKHRSWGGEISREPMFARSVTLDPNCTLDVWSRLATNTSFVEFHELPVRLHQSVISALLVKIRPRARYK